jgi:large subunit ribosomal protein L15
MKLNELKPPRGAVKKRKRRGIGTGSGHGGTSTRGHKGQFSRSGGSIPAWFEGGQMPLQRRLPKRGFTNHFRRAFQVINVGDLVRFDAGAEVTVATLREAGLVRRSGLPVKLLAEGTLDRALTIRVHAASKAAQEKVGQSGGRVEILERA